ncbi:MAG: cytochrome c [Chloroflexi bacterium]|nr:cytochrome c [Chloroflexota bacterium]MDA1271844.1 cytochrome c [Chloroflexota bacterium]
MKLMGLSGLTAGIVLLLAACGGYGDASPNESPASAAPSGQPVADTAANTSEGQQLFTAKGCAACHGANGEGTGIAPALSGHTGGQVRRQVRAPLGLMPVFPPSVVSNEELAQIADYVETLAGEHAHMSESNPGEMLAQHHWMVLFALEEDSGDEAVHHIDHIIGQVTGQHLSQMKEAKKLAEEGELHEAAHIVENMLAGVQVEDLTPSAMHASLARSSILIDDIEGAQHQLDHLMARLGDDPAAASQVAEIQGLLASGSLSDAAHELEELTGTAHEEEHEENGGHGH